MCRAFRVVEDSPGAHRGHVGGEVKVPVVVLHEAGKQLPEGPGVLALEPYCRNSRLKDPIGKARKLATISPGQRGEEGQFENVVLGGITHQEQFRVEVVQDGYHGRLQYLKNRTITAYQWSAGGITCLEVVDHEEGEHVAGQRGVFGIVHAVLPGPGLERADLTDKVLVQI